MFDYSIEEILQYEVNISANFMMVKIAAQNWLNWAGLTHQQLWEIPKGTYIYLHLYIHT